MVTTLEAIKEQVCSINNNAHTIHWGAHIENNVLAAVCGHPSVSKFRGMMVYFTFFEKDDTITLQCETSTFSNGESHKKLIAEKLYSTSERAEKLCTKLVISVLRDYFKG